MAKTAKAAAKSAAQKKGDDLFSDLPEAAPRRLSGKATRVARPTSGAEANYTARHIEVLEGLGRSEHGLVRYRFFDSERHRLEASGRGSNCSSAVENSKRSVFQ